MAYNALLRAWHWVFGSPSLYLHVKCRNSKYTRSSIERFPVADDKVPWTTAFPEYSPVKYTADVVLKQPVWADTDFE
jgi:hypothetical protein